MTSSLPSSRADALRLESRHYFTGKPCKNGHTEKRIAKSKHCLGCLRDRAEERKRRDPVAYFQKVRELRERKSKSAERKRRRLSYLKHRESILARMSIWGKNNPDKRRAYLARRRMASASTNSFTDADIKTLMIRQRRRCANCTTLIARSYHVDHILALARGGTNDKYNIQLLCPPCNQRKSAKDVIDWANENGRLL